ncbi:Sodium Channel Protein Type 4 Subunit Alpha [Manis pentadactyla]|nr:Sodium Channel Protein Type 4 Subunit Alpha [Manis pentadactyla]
MPSITPSDTGFGAVCLSSYPPGGPPLAHHKQLVFSGAGAAPLAPPLGRPPSSALSWGDSAPAQARSTMTASAKGTSLSSPPPFLPGCQALQLISPANEFDLKASLVAWPLHPPPRLASHPGSGRVLLKTPSWSNLLTDKQPSQALL